MRAVSDNLGLGLDLQFTPLTHWDLKLGPKLKLGLINYIKQSKQFVFVTRVLDLCNSTANCKIISTK